MNVVIVQHKNTVVRDLAISMRRLEDKTWFDDELDAELLSMLPEPVLAVSEKDVRMVDPVSMASVEIEGHVPARKRIVADLSPNPRNTKRSRFPVLALVEQVTAEDGIGGAFKGRALMTRERLGASQHDPKGLLKLVSTSTNALEYTKKPELLKSAGFILNSTTRNQSVAEKFNVAAVRLDLGLRGQSIDSLLFGASVLC